MFKWIKRFKEKHTGVLYSEIRNGVHYTSRSPFPTEEERINEVISKDAEYYKGIVPYDPSNTDHTNKVFSYFIENIDVHLPPVEKVANIAKYMEDRPEYVADIHLSLQYGHFFANNMWVLSINISSNEYYKRLWEMVGKKYEFPQINDLRVNADYYQWIKDNKAS
ncbi:hypothetical protein G6M86_20860 [Agrobacterium tumefaciens]|uniref:Uncharacterized protein n=1 Tax=Agrobacterium tumefaciens TaxID=358 RepID=A0AAJ4N6G5_AGRTU|nr:hypothetical protein G6M86_20860 [Agrobacterium tumefaciens]